MAIANLNLICRQVKVSAVYFYFIEESKKSSNDNDSNNSNDSDHSKSERSDSSES